MNEFKPSIVRPSSGSDYESKDFVLHNVSRVKDADIHKGKHISENKNIKSLLSQARTDYNSKQNTNNASKSEIKVKKEKQTKEKESKQILVKIPIDPKMIARLKTGHFISTKADIVPIIPNCSVKQELNDNHNKETHSIKDADAKLTCGQCPKSFKTIVGITNHLQRHLKPIYQCSHCPKKFPTAQKIICRHGSAAPRVAARYARRARTVRRSPLIAHMPALQITPL
ncbi:hypothetical protein MSG28_009196 [Choristoneura fumiferana]|uniref:Uncharacterized protein n=1 Tax=Choristoneura fumiferana TaxID=7141 RepID=A0ACC0KXU5_CHOFU|nr:hypothetical protein MSG28_009196 [Choristoneura fumiferana]